MTELDYGPLSGLIGQWEGVSGKDIAPESDGTEENIYRETITFEAIGEVVNAEEQRLAVLRYHQRVFRIKGGKRIHDQVGYWSWDPATGQVINNFSIPRAVNVIAGGKTESSDERIVFSVVAGDNETAWPIAQSEFMARKADTKRFEMEMILEGDVLSYSQTSVLDIYGKVFDHTDQSTLNRLAD